MKITLSLTLKIGRDSEEHEPMERDSAVDAMVEMSEPEYHERPHVGFVRNTN